MSASIKYIPTYGHVDGKEKGCFVTGEDVKTWFGKVWVPEKILKSLRGLLDLDEVVPRGDLIGLTFLYSGSYCTYKFTCKRDDRNKCFRLETYICG